MPGGGAGRKQPRLPAPAQGVCERAERRVGLGLRAEPEEGQGRSREAWGEDEAGSRAGNRSESLTGVTHRTSAQTTGT